ncbi:P-loop containing nucleoside triphosphate hydrolase protein, partial [Lentinula raphanica]
MSFVPASSFRSEQGLRLLRENTRDLLPYDPHDTSIEVLASILDYKDVLVRTACGSGKTGIIALIVSSLPKIPGIFSSYKPWFDTKPAFIVICPTNELEFDIEFKLRKCGIGAVVLNFDVLMAAQNNNSTSLLWTEVQNSQVLLISPELLCNDSVHKQLAATHDSTLSFKKRCAVLIVDEAHLVYEWGRSFREAYRYIGELRVQLNSTVRLLALTATLREDGPLGYVLKTFGLREGQYIDIHHSNLRPEIRTTTSPLESTLSTAENFPELRWIVNPVLLGITIIFTPDRSSALRITLYLRKCNEYLASQSRIRKWDSLNASVHNTETRAMISAMDVEVDRLIIVSTTILMVGIDFQGVKCIINLEPDDFDKEVQMEGRMRGAGECYVYFSKHTFEEARKRLEEEKNTGQDGLIAKKSQRENSSGKKKKPPMHIHFAKRIASDCRTPIQNETYNNPPFGQHPCSCRDCSARPDPPTFVCICSG